MLVYNNKGRLFLGERYGEPGHWQFPQGGAEARFTPRQNVLRELKEELGLHKKHIGKVTQLKSRHEYEWRKPPAYALNRWRGQRQTFWLVEFLGDDSDINLESHNEQEFRAWRWCSVAEVKRTAAPYRLGGYQGALREFLAFKRARAGSSPRTKKNLGRGARA
jgi:putative (di)nucleoside polyphosphate hydrolase